MRRLMILALTCAAVSTSAQAFTKKPLTPAQKVDCARGRTIAQHGGPAPAVFDDQSAWYCWYKWQDAHKAEWRAAHEKLSQAQYDEAKRKYEEAIAGQDQASLGLAEGAAKIDEELALAKLHAAFPN